MEFTCESRGSGVTDPEIGGLKVVLKECDDINGVVHEYVAATLAQHLGIRTPPFFLLWRGGQPVFASVFIPGVILSGVGPFAYDDYCDWTERRDFDHFIQNHDRHGGNVMYWNNEFYLIDHERIRGYFESPAPWIVDILEPIIESLWCRFYSEFNDSVEAQEILEQMHDSIKNAIARPVHV